MNFYKGLIKIEQHKRDYFIDIMTKTASVLKNHEEFTVSDITDSYGAKCMTVIYEGTTYFIICDNVDLAVYTTPTEEGFENKTTVNSFEDILNTIGDED